MRRYVISVLAVLLLAGSQATAEDIPVAYRLKWLFNASVAGDIMALQQGFFAGSGLDVDVKEGGPEKNAIKELELGYAQFGVASADQVIRALDKGADVTVLAQLFQVNPMQWIYRAELPEIRLLSELRHRRIGVTFGGNDETIMNTLLAKAGLGPSDVSISSVRFDFTPFLTRKVEIWPVYRNSQGVILEDRLAREGEGVRFLNPSKFGVDFVANSVVTSGKMVREHPEIVMHFLKALLQGWEFAMDPANQGVVLTEIAKRDKSTKPDIMARQLAATRDLVKSHPEQAVGRIVVSAWEQTEAIMIRQGQVSGPVNILSHLKLH